MRLYLVVFLTGLAASTGWLPIPPGLTVVGHPAILASSGFMLFVEFFADKIPGVDTVWDLIHSIFRIPAGAALAAGAIGGDSTVMGLAGGLLGGSLSAASFTTKATVRAAVNTSPEPFSNIGVSLAEDVGSVGILWLAVTHPILFGFVLTAILALSAWLVVLLYKYLRAIAAKVRQWVSKAEAPTPPVRAVPVAAAPPPAPRAAKRFCGQCGTPVTLTGAFCARCGTALRPARR